MQRTRNKKWSTTNLNHSINKNLRTFHGFQMRVWNAKSSRCFNPWKCDNYTQQNLKHDKEIRNLIMNTFQISFQKMRLIFNTTEVINRILINFWKFMMSKTSVNWKEKKDFFVWRWILEWLHIDDYRSEVMMTVHLCGRPMIEMTCRRLYLTFVFQLFARKIIHETVHIHKSVSW